MTQALELAKIAALEDEVPVGAVIVKDRKIIAAGYNKKESAQICTRHAEIMAIEEASIKLKNWRLNNCTLYITLEPCLMCAGAIIASRVSNVVFAAHDPKAGAAGSIFNVLNDKRLNHQPNVTSGVLKNLSSEMLKQFFNNKRILKKNLKS